MGLVSFGEKYELRKGRSSSKLVASLGKDATLEIEALNDDSGSVGLTLDWGRCTFEYDTGSMSSKYGFQGKAKGMDVSIVQRVPDNKWCLVPSPDMKVKKSFKKKSSSIEAKASLMDRKASIVVGMKPTSWSKVDAEFAKAGLSNGTISMGRKMKELGMDACELKYNLRKGPEASLSIKPIRDTTAKAIVMPRTQTFELGLNSIITTDGKKKTDWKASCKLNYQFEIKGASIEYKWFF